MSPDTGVAKVAGSDHRNGVTRRNHPPIPRSAPGLGAGKARSTELRQPRGLTQKGGGGDRGRSWSRTRASCRSARELAPHRLGDNDHGSSSPPVFINLVTGKARYSEPCLSRGPARSAEWVGGWFRPARNAEWVRLGGRNRWAD